MGDEVPAEGSGGAPASGSAQLRRMNTGIATLDVDVLIAKLLSVRGRGPNAQVNLPEQDIQSLCLVARDIFLDQPALLQLATPIKICGDIHGQYHDLLRLFDIGGHPPTANYLFLGDYVDRGKRSLETISLLLCYKVKYPQNFFIMRGNHESASINKMYGFYDECKRRYSTKLWKTFTDCFNCLPIAAVVDDKIFCAHGGLSPELTEMDQINRISRPTDVPDTGLLCDLLWSDPDREIIGWGENDRGVSFTFGEDIVKDFLSKHDLDLVCRAHQVVEDGYEFFARRRLVTLFSAPNYCGEFDNAGAMMSVDEALMCSFQILQSNESAQRERYQRRSSGANRGWLTNGPVGAARLSSMEIPDSVVPEEDDPLLAPVLLSVPKAQSSEITYDATGRDLDEGVISGSAPVAAGLVDVSNGAGECSGPSLTTPPPVMAPAPISQAVRRRRNSRQRSIDSSTTSKDDGDSPAAFVPLPSTSTSSSSSNSSSSSSSRNRKIVNNDTTRNRRKMVSPPPSQALDGALVTIGSGALAVSESGGAPAIGLGLSSEPAPSREEERGRRAKPGPTTPSPPKIVRPIVMTSLRGSAAESQSMTSSGEPTAEGGEVVMTAMTSFSGGTGKLLSRAAEVARRIREASDDRAEGDDGVQSPERQRGDSGDGSRYPLSLLTSPLSSAPVTKLSDAIDEISGGGGSRPYSSKSKKRDTHKSSAGGSSSGRRHRHSLHSADDSIRSTTPSSSNTNSNSGSEARRRRRTKLAIATSETSQNPGDYDRHGNTNHNHTSDGDVPGKHEPLLVNSSLTTPRIVSPSSAGNGTVRSSNSNTSFSGTVSSISNGNTSFGGTVSKSRRFYPRNPSVVAIESMSDSSGTGIPRQFYGGMATTSSTSGDARRDSMSISEHMSEVCVLPSDKGISSAKCGEIREDGEEPQQGLDPFDRSAKQIATAAAAAVAAAESEADGRDVALRVDMHQKQQEENDLEAGREAIGVSKDAGGHARRDREVKEKASRKKGEDGRRMREKRRAKSRARKEKEAVKGKEGASLPRIIQQSSITVGAADEAYAEYGFLTPPTTTGNPNMDHSGVSTSKAFANGGKGIDVMTSKKKENGGTFDRQDALVRSIMVSDSSSGNSSMENSNSSMENNSSSLENSNSSMENSNSSRENSSGFMSEEKVEEDDEQQQQQQQDQGTLDSVEVESPGTGTSTHSVETRVSNQSSFVDSFVSSTDSDRKRTRRGVLGAVKKGLGSVWEKVTADHPQPLPVDRTLTKEEQKALHLREEKERLNDWSTNSVAEQHQMAEVLKVEEERVWV